MRIYNIPPVLLSLFYTFIAFKMKNSYVSTITIRPKGIPANAAHIIWLKWDFSMFALSLPD